MYGLGAGEAAAQVEITADLHPGHRRHWVLAPDIWYGASDELTFGLVHAGMELDRFQPDYLGEALDVLWRHWRARFIVRDTTPYWKPALALGAFADSRHGRWTFAADPYVLIGLANNEHGNRSALWLPVRASVDLARVAIDVRTGWNSELAVITEDGWHVPMWLGARVRATASVEVGAAIGFYTLVGPQNDGNERALFVTVAWSSTPQPR